MNEAQIGTLELVRQVLDATAELEFKQAANDAQRYAWIEAVLRRFNYRGLGRTDRGVVLAYLRHLSGFSRAQLTRLVAHWVDGGHAKGR